MLFKKNFYISHIVSNVSWRINEKSLRKFDLHIRQNLQINPFVPCAPSWGKERVHWDECVNPITKYDQHLLTEVTVKC